MDQEECSTEENQRKLFTRSAARHLRRKRLNDARRIEKQLAALTDGLTTAPPPTTTTTTDTREISGNIETITKSKARRLRKRNKAREPENCCSLCDPCISVNDTDSPQGFVRTEEDTRSEGTVTKSTTRKLRRRNRSVRQTENNCCYCNDTCLSTVERDSLDCRKTTDPINSNDTINGEKPEPDEGDSVDRERAEAEERSINNARGDTKEEFRSASRSELVVATVVESLENSSELRCFPESSKLLDDVQDESNAGLDKRTDRTKGEKEPVSGVTQQQQQQQLDGNTQESIINSKVAVHSQPDQERLNGSTELDSRAAPSGSSASQSKRLDIMAENKGNNLEKSREEIKAEREAKKAAKAAAKAKAKAAGKGREKENDERSVPPTTNSNVSEATKLPTVELAPPSAAGNLSANNSSSRVRGGEDDAGSAGNVNTEKEGEVAAKKSKAELRAERRAKQEAQRAAKQQILTEKGKVKIRESLAETDTSAHPAVASAADPPEKAISGNVGRKPVSQKKDAHEVNLFKHLYHERGLACMDVPSINSGIHPAIVKLGAKYANKVVVGSNARCIALLAAVKELFEDFEPPSQAGFMRGLEAKLQESEAYLHHCRPLAVSMQNALRHLKMTMLSPQLPDENAKTKLQTAIDTYILEQIELAGKAISQTIQKKISEGDVILTYGYSTLIHKILLDAHNAEKRFRVIIADGRPWLEGKEQLKRLTQHGIECSYVLINGLSYVMPEVSKVFLGAHAILANGAVMSRVGTAQVALMARAFNVPVLVACETHKSCERVQTDSIVYNELGNADDLARDNESSGAKKSLLANWRTKKSLNLLNIMYDVTPADLVTAVVTELAILPCTSVPVILRIKPSEI